MEQIQKTLTEKAMQYTEEAFAEHEAQIFAAFDLILACIDEARNYGLLALEEKAEEWKKKEGEEIPLRELLLDMVQEIVDVSYINSWEEKVCRQIMESNYSGYEWYIAEIYVTGCKEVHRGATTAQYYQTCQAMVPARWQERFDSYWECRSEKEQARENAHIEEWVQCSFQRTAAIRTAFHKRFGEMERERLEGILKELPDKIVAAGLVGAEDTLRNRFLENMAIEQRNYIMAEWYENKNEEYCLLDIEKAMERMTIAAGLMGEI